MNRSGTIDHGESYEVELTVRDEQAPKAATGIPVTHNITFPNAAGPQSRLSVTRVDTDQFIDEQQHTNDPENKLSTLLNLCQDVAELKEHYQKRKTTVETPLGPQRESDFNAGPPTVGGPMSPTEAAAWEKIRIWFRAHTSRQVRRTAILNVRGEFNVTAIHVVCRHGNPPLDILDLLLKAAGPEACEHADTLEWLPLHYACGALAPAEVLERLVKCYPLATSKQDKRGRTPLHFSLGSAARQKEECEDSLYDKNQWHSIYDPGSHFFIQHESNGSLSYHGLDARSMSVLTQNGAASRKDENGMLPLHYACAYLAITEDALRILIESFPSSLVALDGQGRSPLHFTMGNSDKIAAPMVTKVLLSMSSVYLQSASENAPSLQVQLVNMADREGQLPIHLLAISAKRSSSRGSKGATSSSSAQPWTRKESNKMLQQHQSAKNCLRLYLNAKPEPTAALLTALQTLPKWLRDSAVTSPHVQSFLNTKITQRFLTTMLMLDFYVLIVIIIAFRLATTGCVAYRQCFDIDNEVYPCTNAETLYPGSNGEDFALYCGGVQLYVLYVGATYFLLREIVQALSLQSLNLFRMWVVDPKNWLDMITFTAVYFFTASMQFGLFHPQYNEVLQTGAALTTGLLWGSLIALLKSSLVDFAVFVQGVIFVVRKLGAFCMCAAVIITAFALMFVTEFQSSTYCTPSYIAAQADILNYYFPWCDLRLALIKTLTMMVGQVDETDFPTRISKAMYCAFGFAVTLLLFNVLIAIVIDSYSVIRNERAAIVFWSNRLDFVAEMDAILSGPWKWKQSDEQAVLTAASASLTPNLHPFDYYWWKNVVQVFEDQELNKCSFEYFFYFIIRFVAIFLVIPIWLLVGLVTAGMLWPPQVREFLLLQKTTEKFKVDDALHGFYELSELKENMARFKLQVKAQMKADRDEIKSFGEAAREVKSSTMADLEQIREVMQSMLEVRRANPSGYRLRRRRTAAGTTGASSQSALATSRTSGVSSRTTPTGFATGYDI